MYFRLIKEQTGMSVLPYREEKEKEGKRNDGEEPLRERVCSIDRKGIGNMIFQARGRGKELFLFMGMGSCGVNFV